jgi:hypothetical protein
VKESTLKVELNHDAPQVGPLISAHCSTYMTGAKWSLTRPGVFYISKSDGTIEIWDLLDRQVVKVVACCRVP